ncbi:MAG: dihydropteroate synthase [Gammaproteobacteria bacterium]
MGVLNVTPDSFSDGGDFFSVSRAMERAGKMVVEGAAVIDVGGESTRPGAEPVSVQQELDRVIPVIERIHVELPVPISIDTSKPEVMNAAVAAGAGMINDVNSLQTDGAVAAAVATDVPVCLMHRQGHPRNMQKNPVYGDVVKEVCKFLNQRAKECQRAGISSARILLDPGFGFGKTLDHNLLLLTHLDRLVALGYPVLVGLSRKSMIGAALDLAVDQRLHASLALATLAVWQGAALVRAHDVRATLEAIRMCDKVRTAKQLQNS